MMMELSLSAVAGALLTHRMHICHGRPFGRINGRGFSPPCTHVPACMCVHVCTLCKRVCMQVCICMCIYAHLCVHMCVGMHAYAL